MMKHCATSLQNRSNEDFYFISERDGLTLYAVVDGHGGGNKYKQDLDSKHVALYVIKYVHDYISDLLGGLSYDSSKIEDVIKEAFMKIDQTLFELGGKHGCTFNGVIDTSTHYIFINLGDSRSVYFDEEGIIFQTVDHKPSTERLRIEEAGGKVIDGRVGGNYALSRAFGDFNQKLVDGKYSPYGPMSAIPDVTLIKKRKGTIILGTDGVYDGFSDSEELISFYRKIKTKKPSLEISKHASKKNGDDDTTCIVLEC